MPTVGENIRNIRESKSMTVDELARKSGYKNSATIIAIEAGNKKPAYEKRLGIARALGVRVKDLYRKTEREELLSDIEFTLRGLDVRSLEMVSDYIVLLKDKLATRGEIVITIKTESGLSLKTCICEAVLTDGEVIKKERTAKESEGTISLVTLLSILKEIDDNESNIRVISRLPYIVDGINKWIYGWAESSWKKRDGSELKDKVLWAGLYNRMKKQMIQGEIRNEGTKEVQN